MKKLMLLLLVVGMALFSAPAGAGLIEDVGGPNTSDEYLSGSTYWIGDDYNEGDNLTNSDPVTETAWLNALLGFSASDSGEAGFAVFDNKWGDENDPFGTGFFDVGADVKDISIDTSAYYLWDYAVVKYDGLWSAYENDGNNILKHEADWGVSHISWFNVTAVPEPATMLLLGTGLVGIIAARRKKFLKK